MDQTLYEASHAGNMLLLSRRNTNGGGGQRDVCFLNKTCFAELRNQGGFTPMHIASANGYLDIVKENLCRFGATVCHLRGGKRDLTPLHCAAICGRVEILKEIISACPESLEDVTLSGETAFHLAAKNNRVEAIHVLVELTVDSPMITVDMKRKILNMKNVTGNSALHVAITERRHEVVRCLVGSGVTELNDVNECGLTALDLVLRLPKISKSSYAEDKKTEDVLRSGGALRGRDLAAVNWLYMPSKAEARRSGLRKRVTRPGQLSIVY
ncbi:ankyrin repeat-containing protein BDA1-like [Malus domestica]|uniref:ankyrin repeat-containing protein BDA1-like n=1 Tax=Malus domestica TaxID=3750 RepID=UPI00397483D7